MTLKSESLSASPNGQPSTPILSAAVNKPVLPRKLSKSATSIESPLFLDLNCGVGDVSWAASKMGFDVIGVGDDELASTIYRVNLPFSQLIEGCARDATTLERCRQLVRNRELIVFGSIPYADRRSGEKADLDSPYAHTDVIANWIAALKPKCAVIETEASDGGLYGEIGMNAYQTLIRTGSTVHRVVLDASDYGVAHQRKRAFHLVVGKTISKEALLAELYSMKMKEVTVSQVLSGLPTATERLKPQKSFLNETSHLFPCHVAKNKLVFAGIIPNLRSGKYRRLDSERPSHPLAMWHRKFPLHPDEHRSITVLECMAIQGFTREFELRGSITKQQLFASAVSNPPLIKVVLTALCRGCKVRVR